MPNSQATDHDNGKLTTVLLCHFGGPTCEIEVAPFLRRLFEDPAIIRFPLGKWLRSRLAHSIARKRAPRVIQEYRSIGFSPINAATLAQAKQLESLLKTRKPSTRVLVINRYTPPFAEEVLAQVNFTKERCFLISLYPHFSSTSTGSSFDEIDRLVRKNFGLKQLPGVRVPFWWNHPSYLAYSFSFVQVFLQKHIQTESRTPITFLFSAHSIPKRYVEKGDPYQSHIESHFLALKEMALQWLSSHEKSEAVISLCHFELAYQSRVGPVEWLKPYTDHVIPALGRERGGKLVIVPISFVSDHLETLYEMDHTYKELALASGFSDYKRVALPNDDKGLAECLRDILVEKGF